MSCNMGGGEDRSLKPEGGVSALERWHVQRPGGRSEPGGVKEHVAGAEGESGKRRGQGMDKIRTKIPQKKKTSRRKWY